MTTRERSENSIVWWCDNDHWAMRVPLYVEVDGKTVEGLLAGMPK